MAIEKRVLNDHFSNSAGTRNKLSRRFRLQADRADTEAEQEKRYLEELEEAMLSMGVLQRLAKCKGRGRGNLSRLLLMLLANEHELSPRFRSEIEEVISDRRECRTLKLEEEGHSPTEELHEMQSVDDLPPQRPQWQSVLRPATQNSLGVFT